MSYKLEMLDRSIWVTQKYTHSSPYLYNHVIMLVYKVILIEVM